MDTQTPVPGSDPAQLAVIQKKLFLDNRIRSGLNWFYWIAGLSLINTIIYLFGKNFTFVVGLGVTQIIDGFLSAMANRIGEGGIIVRFIGFAIDVLIAGIFVVFGFLGKKQYRWPIIIGMILYAIDGVILLLFQDIFSAGFHAFALFGIVGGLRSISELEKLEKSGITESIESIRNRMPSLQPQVTSQQKRIRWVLVGMILLVIIITFVIISFQH
jgi:hypothetical protein